MTTNIVSTTTNIEHRQRNSVQTYLHLYTSHANPSSLTYDRFAMNLRQHHVVVTADDANLVSENYQHRVHIRHPGYPEGKNTLFNLLAQDRPNGGIHYGTLITICGIIAGNRFDGLLSRTRLHQDCFELQPDDVVDVGTYYYILPEEVSGELQCRIQFS